MMRLTRRHWFAAACGSAASGAGASHPNFVFILIDDLGWTDGGCFGSSYYRTPNIDRLARQGVRFTDAYAAGPVCSPTRASILTGKYPARLGMTDIIQGHGAGPSKQWLPPEVKTGLPLEEVTIVEALRPAGYAAAGIGKWHLGAAGLGPWNQGFDFSMGGSHVGLTSDFFYPGWRTARAGGPRAAAVAARLGVSDPRAGIPLEGRPGEYLTDRLTHEATAFIRGNRTRPFFLMLSHYAVHIPIQAKQEMIDRYGGKPQGASPHRNPIYAAMLESVDESVGEVMRTLEECGLAENTVIVFTSDNGGLLTPQPPNGLPPTSNNPLREGKGHLYEGGIRVPLLIRSPGVARAGSVCTTPVISNDFFPTVLDIAGVRLPPSGIDGISLKPLLAGRNGWRREALYWHWPHYAIPGALPASSIRQGPYKLIEFLEDGRVELYDLAKDIGERRDLARTQPKRAAAMLGMLRRWKESVGAQAMRPNPAYKE